MLPNIKAFQRVELSQPWIIWVHPPVVVELLAYGVHPVPYSAVPDVISRTVQTVTTPTGYYMRRCGGHSFQQCLYFYISHGLDLVDHGRDPPGQQPCGLTNEVVIRTQGLGMSNVQVPHQALGWFVSPGLGDYVQ